MGLMLHVAEGGKTQPAVSITNSDPFIIKTFVQWVEACLGIPREQLRGNVHIYPDVDVDEAEQYWSAVIGIPRSRFYRAQIDQRTGKMVEKRGKLRYGTVHVTVMGHGRADLHRKVMGWIAGLVEIGENSARE